MNKNIFLITFIALLYIFLSIILIPKKAFFSGDNAAKFIHIQSLIQNSWKKLQVNYPGEYIDEEHKHFPIRKPTFYEKDKRFFFIFPLSFILVSSILYYLLGYSGLYLLPLISSILTIYLMYRLFLERYNIDSTFIIILGGLCSPIFFYGCIFWEHSIALFFSFLAFYIFFKKEEKRINYLLSGVFFGISVWFRLEIVFLFFAFFISYSLIEIFKEDKRLKNIIIFTIGFFIALLPLLLYNKKVFGNITGAHASINYSLYQGKSILFLIKNKIKDCYHLLFDTGISRNINLIFLLLTFLLSILNLSKRFRRFERVKFFLLFLILLSSIYVTCLCYFSRIIGLLVTTSFIYIIFLNLPNLLSLKKTSSISNLLFYTAIFYFIFLFTPPGFGDKQWGPRFLLYLYPLLIILSMDTFYNINKLEISSKFISSIKGIFMTLVVLGFFVQSIGIYKNYSQKKDILKEVESLKRMNSQIIVTDVWWLPQEASSIFYKKCFFWIRSKNHLNDLLSRFKKKGIENFIFATFIAPTSKDNVARTLDHNWYQTVSRYGYRRIKVNLIMGRFENSLLIYKGE